MGCSSSKPDAQPHTEMAPAKVDGTTSIAAVPAASEPEDANAAPDGNASLVVEVRAGTKIAGTRQGQCKLNVFGSTENSFPADAASVTKEWLSAALNTPVESYKTTVCDMGQVSNTLLLTDIVYGTGPGINADGMPKGLALKMNKDEEAARKPCSEMSLYTRELHFYSSGLQHEVPVKSPKVYGVWTDGTEHDEFNLIMLEDMNQEWVGFSGYDGCPPLKDWLNIFAEVQKIHIQYWQDPSIAKAPLSMTGSKFSLKDWAGPIAALPMALPVFKAEIEKVSYKGNPLPEEWTYFFDMMEWLCADNNKRLDVFMAKMEAELGTRPQTLCHGDFNCGNFWESKARKGEYSIADWQVMKMSPIVLDFVTPFSTIEVSDVADGKWKGFIEDCYKQYHGTPIETDYPIQTFIHDWKLMTIGFWSFVVPLLTGAVALPPGDKRDFAWEKFYPVAGGRFCSLYKDLQLWDVAKEYIGEGDACEGDK